MLFTIGTSNRTQADFFEELDRREIRLLVDVRSKPWSRTPWACRRPLEVYAPTHGIEYVWSGAILGGLATLEVTDSAFHMAADAVADAAEDRNTAIFCAEGDPALCHRSYKIAAHLLATHGHLTNNILRNGREESVAATLRRTQRALLPPRDDWDRLLLHHLQCN